jgi:hypothetical protein
MGGYTIYGHGTALPLSRWDRAFLAATVVVPLGVVLCIGYLFIYGVKLERTEIEQVWRDAKIIAICRDGTRIWELRDGRVVDRFGYAVSDPKTACK